ncbi:hypothetical protein [Lentilactobacillus kisonensis]|uniref:Uncharacterized protein n=1 Tax=Lentilactobacillus kisonensis F0435 TaxID=797516 RepID=H1LFM9_9LACO|nr:hypothetical protein [Lentilactobacillus kisonensis]EHO51670.1 hypothetical protein HMPREF9104_01405 [Lentilactobacillus kisonensis F0435]
MKTRILFISLVSAGVMSIPGCNRNKADLNNSNNHNNSSNQLNQLLSPATAKVPEDSQTDKPNLLYSQFYKDGNQWHWKLSSKQDGLIDDSQIKSVKSAGQKDVYKFNLVSNTNKKYQLNFNWINGGHQAYTINTSYHSVDANFILADTNQSAEWHNGTPQALEGSWATDYTKNPNNSQQLPYIKQFLNITDTTTNSFVNEYDGNHRLYNSNTNSNTNNLSYQATSQGLYVLKSYSNTSTPVVYNIAIINANQIKVTGLTSAPLTLVKSSSTATTTQDQDPITSSQSGSSTASSATSQQATPGTTSNHLTDQQVVNWIWPQVKSIYPNMNVSSTDFTYMPQMRNGLLYVDVLENHDAAVFKNSKVDSNTDPRVASFRVNSSGQLEEMDSTTGSWIVVSQRTSK